MVLYSLDLSLVGVSVESDQRNNNIDFARLGKQSDSSLNVAQD